MARLENLREERDQLPPMLVPRIVHGFIVEQRPLRNAIESRASDLLPHSHTSASKQEEIETPIE
jgi:hypothetical protein